MDVMTKTQAALPDVEVEPAAMMPAPVQPVQDMAPSRPRITRVPDQQEDRASVDTVMMRHSPEIGQLFAALARAQAAPGYGLVVKTEEATIKSDRANYTYEFETLAAVLNSVRPFLAAEEISLMQFPFTRSRTMVIRTMLGHSSGQWIYNDLLCELVSLEPRAVGSASSFLKRYGIKALCAVSAMADDDDAALQVRQPEPPSRPQAAPRRSEAPAEAAKNVGLIEKIQEAGGATLVRLTTGFTCGTRDQSLADGLRAAREAGKVVELVTHPSSDPGKFAPVLDEILPR